MELDTTITNRVALVQFLHNETGLPVRYAGAPTFHYRVGPYTVLRNARIRVVDDEADPVLIERMQELGYLWKRKQDSDLAFSIGGSVLTRVNLVNAFAARGDLISKAVGSENAFYVDRALVRRLKDVCPASVSDFHQVLAECGGDSALRGLFFLEGQVVFNGFPKNLSEEEKEACRDFAETVVVACAQRKWQKGETRAPRNEKYTFRTWMNKMGLSGEGHARTRCILLERLDGTFRTKRQKAAAISRRREARHASGH